MLCCFFVFLATVNQTGTDCPYALKMVACQVLLEITTFLRETYQYIPKSKLPKKEQTWDKSVQSRRWSSVLGSPGHSERSNSKSSQGEAQTVGKKILTLKAKLRRFFYSLLWINSRSSSCIVPNGIIDIICYLSTILVSCMFAMGVPNFGRTSSNF